MTKRTPRRCTKILELEVMWLSCHSSSSFSFPFLSFPKKKKKNSPQQHPQQGFFLGGKEKAFPPQRRPFFFCTRTPNPNNKKQNKTNKKKKKKGLFGSWKASEAPKKNTQLKKKKNEKSELFLINFNDGANLRLLALCFPLEKIRQ